MIHEDNPTSTQSRKGVVQMSRRLLSLCVALFLGGVLTNPLAAQMKTKAASHDLAGKETCLMCHAPEIMPPVPDVPESHEGRTNETCVWCHAPDAAMVTQGAKAASHDFEGKDNCLMCHTAGAMEPVPDVPESHEGRTNAQCVWCHKPAG
jgi:hypothetical protein